MSGAQAKAAVICGCIGICAESSYEALKKRHDQGWVLEIIDDLDELIRRVIEAKAKKQVILRLIRRFVFFLVSVREKIRMIYYQSKHRCEK